MEKVRFYRAINGRLFDTKDACLEYEKEYYKTHPTVAMLCQELRTLANNIENVEYVTHTVRYESLTKAWADFKKNASDWIEESTNTTD